MQLSVPTDPNHKKRMFRGLGMSLEGQSFGPYLKLVSAQATDPLILDAAQNGGFVTALLIFSLKERMIDGAVISGVSVERPFWPVPTLALTPEEIFRGAGTRYSFSSNIHALSEAVSRGLEAVAFVGTPCEVAAVRKMQQSRLDLARPVKLVIGLMCSEAFSYDDLMVNYVQNRLGVDLHAVRKTEIAGNKMTITTDLNEAQVPLADVRKFARRSCRKCCDFSSEQADVSAGGLGLKRLTFVVVRTPIGEHFLDEAENAGAIVTRPVRMDDLAVKLLVRLSQKKRDRGVKT